MCSVLTRHTGCVCVFSAFVYVKYTARCCVMWCELYYYYFPFDFSECFTFEHQFAYI